MFTETWTEPHGRCVTHSRSEWEGQKFGFDCGLVKGGLCQCVHVRCVCVWGAADVCLFQLTADDTNNKKRYGTFLFPELLCAGAATVAQLSISCHMCYTLL